MKQLKTLVLKASKNKKAATKELDEMVERLHKQKQILEANDFLNIQFAKGELVDMKYTKPAGNSN